jgi:hypothetical protein
MIKGYIDFTDSESKKIARCHMGEPMPCHRGDTIKIKDLNYYIHHVDWKLSFQTDDSNEDVIRGEQYLDQTIIVGTNPPDLP